jgi:PAS domain S-box-containing protein
MSDPRRPSAIPFNVEDALEALSTGVWWIRHDGAEAYFSPNFLACFGLEGAGDMQDFPRVRACVDPGDLARHLAVVRVAAERGESYLTELRVRRANDGAERTLRVRGKQIADAPDGALTFGTIMDVTDSVELLDMLTRTRSQLETAERIGGTGSWTWDVRTNAVNWSTETYRILGVPLGTTPTFDLVLAAAVDDSHRARFLVTVQATLEQNAPFEFEMPARRPDGGIIVLETKGVVERDAAGAPLRMVGTMRNVTRIREAERELRDREARFRLLAESSPNGVFLTDRMGRTTYANERLLQWFAMDFDAFAAGQWRLRVLPEDRLMLDEMRREPSSRERPFDYAYRIEVGESTRWMRIRTQPLLGADGEFAGHVGSVQDTTDERKAAEERALLEGQLQQARRLESVGLLAGGIAHDFNNLLVGILGNASYARELADAGPNVMAALADIERAGERAAELTKQLLKYAGRAPVERLPVDVGAITRELPALLGARVPPSVTLRVDAPDGMVVLGDRTELQQVIMNFVTNAVDAIGPTISGTVTLRVAVESLTSAQLSALVFGADREPGEYVVVTVRDTGAGMSPEVVSRMFDPFYSTKGTGRGLGLAAALGLVSSHRGAIAAISQVGVGTEMRLVLPAAEARANVIEPTSAPQVTAEEATGTILLVDDEPAARRVAQRTLVRAGYRVVEASNGHEALACFDAGTDWAGAVIDFTMPGMNGDVCAARLRERHSTLPILIISGFAEQDLSEQLRGVRRMRFLAKPYRAAELVAALASAIGSSKRSSGELPWSVP